MNKYMSIDGIVNSEKYPFTKGQVRHFVANRKTNGLTTSIRKIGRRIYLREDLFDEWIETHLEDSGDDQAIVSFPSIDDMELTIRTTNCLNRSKIGTIKELINKTESELLRLRNMGKFSVNEIKDKLALFGLELKVE